jgi:hypothetical protein
MIEMWDELCSLAYYSVYTPLAPKNNVFQNQLLKSAQLVQIISVVEGPSI